MEANMVAIDIEVSFQSLQECFDILENVLNRRGNPAAMLRESARTALGKLRLHFSRDINGCDREIIDGINPVDLASFAKPTYAVVAPSTFQNEIYSMNNNAVICSDYNIC
ncbi:hypothetical protein AVEN_239059-1 [Araneus ventricosus]|uniref:Uncharacterized protein n=1 Tax=Araneus ventricosus TaxID=182803 RepID=A0A4Y2NNH0_ARAVE|nr:hypothetical protein AVEN_239059-1 [Araneus ventricosus]